MGSAQSPEAKAAILPAGGALLLFDGQCGLCDRTVRFVLNRDRKDAFVFATLQGELARRLLAPHGVDPRDLDTFHLLVDIGEPTERVISRGRGAVAALRLLPGAWGAVGAVLGVVPGVLLDAGYRLVAATRFVVFGRVEACDVPDPAQRRKLIG